MSLPYRIALEGGPDFTMGGGEDTLLRGALRAGLPFPYDCSTGSCGGCRFELLEGEVQTLWDQAPGLSERERRRGKRLACQSRPLTDCRVRARLEVPSEAALPPHRMPARLVERRTITHDMAEFTFAVAPQVRFRAGQYALLHLPGVAGVRAYSMDHEDRAEGLWRFIVRRVPGGSGSTVLFDRLVPGDAIEVDGPYGHAWLRDGERDVVCVAGGSGLGPMLSVARAVLAGPTPRRVRFFLGLRSQLDLGAVQELAGLRGPRWALTVVLSQPDPSIAWDGPVGFVHEVLAAQLDGVDAASFDHHVAGPPKMVEAVQDLLILQHRVPLAQVRLDRF